MVDRVELVRFYGTGEHTLDECAVQFGVSRQRIHQILKSEGVQTVSKTQRFGEMRAESEALILDAAERGEHFNEIAALSGRSANYVRRICKKHGIVPKRTAGGRYLRWTRERIIEAMQDFNRRHGRPPSGSDWLHNREPGCPATSGVIHHFGSWNAAMKAAGFEPRKSGRPRKDQDV